MKKHIINLILFSCAMLSYAQWQTEVRLTNNTDEDRSSFNNSKWIASQGTDIHLVWFSGNSGVHNLLYMKSTNQGMTWGNISYITSLVDAEQYPSLCLDGTINPVIHVAWQDYRFAPNYEVYYKRSTNRGVSWESEIRISDGYENSQYPSIAASGSTVHIVWTEGNSVFYKRSSDGGVTWLGSANGILLAEGIMPAISLTGTYIHIVFQKDDEIYYVNSINDGLSWGAATRLTYDAAISRNPGISVSGNNIHIVWHDIRDGNYEIYYKKSGDGGLNWETDKRLTNDSYTSYHPSVFASDSIIHVVWYDVIYNYRVLYKKSLDGGANWEADVLLENSDAGGSFNPSVTAFGTYVLVVWEDTRDGNSEIYYTRNPSGNVTGINDNEFENPIEFLLSQNYPNPFNPSTVISYQLPVSSNVTLKVFDVLGNEIATLINEEKPAGSYEVNFNASILSSGIYFYKLQAGSFSETKKLILLK